MRRLEHGFGERLASGSSQWRCSPISYSRPSTRSTASQSTKSGSAGPPIRASSASHAADGLGAPAERGDRALDPRARRAVHPVGRLGEHRFEPAAERDQRADQRVERVRRRRPAASISAGVGLGEFGLQAIAGIALGSRRAHRRARAPRASSVSIGPNGCALAEPLQPAVAGQRARRLDRVGDRAAARLVIAGDVGQPRGEPAPPPARRPIRGR